MNRTTGIIVAKLGGTCVSSNKMMGVSGKVITGDKRIHYVVISAPAPEKPKVTDLLYRCHEEAMRNISFVDTFNTVASVFREVATDSGIDIDRELTELAGEIAAKRPKAWVSSRGEWLNAKIFAARIGFAFVDAAELIRFNKNGKVNRQVTRKQIREKLLSRQYVVIPGFYGATASGEINTLTRDGSDTSAALVTAAVEAEIYHNYKTVRGFLRTNPEWVEDAELIEQMTYGEGRELSYVGAKVLHRDVIPPLLKAGIPVRVLSILEPSHPGTLILPDEMLAKNAKDITGIAGQSGFSKVTIQKTGMNDEAGFASKILTIFAKHRVNVDQLLTSVDSLTIIFRDGGFCTKRDNITRQLKEKCRPDTIEIRESELALIAVVGKKAATYQNVQRAVTALSNAGILHTVNDGSSKLSFIVGVPNDELKQAVQVLYAELCA